MNFRRVKHMLLRLSPEQKIAGIGSLIVLASAFLPWYSVVFNFNEKGITESGFSGDLGVIGFVIFLLTGIGLTFLMSEHLYIKLPRFGMKKENITMFLMGESAFLALLTLAVYTKRSLEYTNAELRFGLYLALIGSVLAAFAQYAEMQKSQTKDVQAFFGQEEVETTAVESIEEEFVEEKPEEIVSEMKTEEAIEEPEDNELFEETTKIEPEQESFFPETNETEETSNTTESIDENTEEPEQVEAIEDEEPQEESAIEVEEKIIDEPIAEESSDAVEEPQEEIISEEVEPEVLENETVEEEAPELTVEDVQPKEETRQDDQGSYFTREAGIESKSNIKVDIDSIKKVEKKVKEPEAVQQNMSFYDDF